jgi:Uma2 family endonuclease
VTISPLPPAHLLTIAEYAALGADEHGRTELMEGNLVMSPSPTPAHARAVLRMCIQLTSQLPDDVEVLPDVDIDLELLASDQPGSARRPDVVVVERSATRRVDAGGGLLRASDVLVAVEIVSPGSRRIDRIVKRAEYADAGIPHYWIVDLDPPLSLLACHLGPGPGYRDEPPATGRYATDDPFPIRLDLDQIQ